MEDETIISAESPVSDLRFSADLGSLTLAADQGDRTSPAVSIVAYTGAAMVVAGYQHPIVVDLEGMTIPGTNRPILFGHSPDRIVGHTTSIRVQAGQLIAEGILSGSNAITQEIIGSGKSGFPWQASIGAGVRKVDLIRAGQSVTVNGREYRGPVFVARQSTIKEVSIVALGADDDTRTAIAAKRHGGYEMFEAWLKAEGWDEDQITDKQKASLKAAFEASQKPTRSKGDDDGDEGVSIIRAKAAAETRRINQIHDIAADFPTIMASAIEAGWDASKTELEVLRASAPKINGISKPSRDQAGSFTPEIIEAGILASLGVSDKDRSAIYNERTLEAARPYERVGLKDLMFLCCQLDKKEGPRVWGDGEKIMQAGFSTYSLPGILENSINKLALLAYRRADIQVLQFARIGSTPDFKKVSRVRMLGTGRFERVGKAGELTSGKLGEQKFENQADTYGTILAIDRQTVMNDDLQVLSDAGSEIGYTGAEVINQLGFEKLLAAQAGGFFSAGNGNLLTGLSSAFGSTSLNAANTLFRKQKAGPGTKPKDQQPININAEILLVPPEAEVAAQILTGSAEIRPGGVADAGTMNPWRGRYRVVSAPHLSDSSYTGNSLTAWYLFANPDRLPAMEVLFVGGRREPRVERVPLPSQQLGIGIRGYIDVGVEMMDPNASVKATGAT